MIFDRLIRAMEHAAATVLIALVRFYRRHISRWLPPSCRFEPSCSAYAVEALQKKRLPVALFRIIVRLLKCNPFHPGGYDPLK